MSFREKNLEKKDRESEWFSHEKIDRILTERIEGYPIHPDKRKEDNKTVRLFVNKMSSKVEKGMCELDRRTVMSFFAGQKKVSHFSMLENYSSRINILWNDRIRKLNLISVILPLVLSG